MDTTNLYVECHQFSKDKKEVQKSSLKDKSMKMQQIICGNYS